MCAKTRDVGSALGPVNILLPSCSIVVPTSSTAARPRPFGELESNSTGIGAKAPRPLGQNSRRTDVVIPLPSDTTHRDAATQRRLALQKRSLCPAKNFRRILAPPGGADGHLQP